MSKPNPSPHLKSRLEVKSRTLGLPTGWRRDRRDAITSHNGDAAGCILKIVRSSSPINKVCGEKNIGAARNLGSLWRSDDLARLPSDSLRLWGAFRFWYTVLSL